MNRDAMVEAGAQGIVDKFSAHDWDTISERWKEDQRYVARAVLDAVLPQITNVEQIHALPQHSLLMGVLKGGMVPNFLMWEDSNIYDLQADWDVVKSEDLISQYESVTVVWRP